MLDEHQSRLAAAYYERVTGKTISPGGREKLDRVLASGLHTADIMTALDEAVAVIGLGGYEIDYLNHALARLREVWREWKER